MGLMDNLKAKLGPLKGKVGDLAQQHEGKIEHGLEKAAQVVDSKTKGKYSSQIRTGTSKAKDALGRLADSAEKDGKGGGTDSRTP
ncbi:antitoxin [Streptomyces sp. NPDC046261]|uniref:antitoxin n=1 Tax=Streptomyces sp. NPDC046261 TaxID=3157200 RepID=UPI0033E5A2F2